jgi:hypothetical protein
VKKLSLFGMDFTYPNAHDAEKGRACVEFWLGIAVAQGIELAMPKTTSLMDACGAFADRFYGYDGVDLAISRRDGRIAVDMTDRAALPTAEEIEASATTTPCIPIRSFRRAPKHDRLRQIQLLPEGSRGEEARLRERHLQGPAHEPGAGGGHRPALRGRLEIAAGNGYAAGGNQCTVASSTQASGAYKSILNDPAQWTAAGGVIGPFRYAVLQNSTAGLLIGYVDYGLAITLQIGEIFIADLDQVAGLFTLT